MKSKLFLASLMLCQAYGAVIVNKNSYGKYGYCNDLKVGQQMRVSLNAGRSKTGVRARYTLVRESEDTHTAYVDLNIKGNEQMARKLRDKINICYEIAAHKLVDGSGRKLKLRLWDTLLHKDKIKKPPRVSIEVIEKDSRSSSGRYAENISCSTIVHEAFHLLTLADEYEEKWRSWNPHFIKRITGEPFVEVDENNKPAMNCRVLGDDESIMHNSYLLFFAEKVLFTKHIDSIIYPNCLEKNRLFYSCQKNAYRTTRSNGGVLGCRRMKDECYDNDWQGY